MPGQVLTSSARTRFVRFVKWIAVSQASAAITPAAWMFTVHP